MKDSAADKDPDAKPDSGEPTPPKSGGSKRLRLLAMLGAPLLLGGAVAASYVFLPGVGQALQSVLPGHAAPAPAQVASNKPMFVDLPEMAVTLPNGGRPRQLRIRMSLELAKKGQESPTAEILSPRLYDALLTYLRTLRDGEVEGGLAIDRMRADLFRRTDIMLGAGVVRDVLITSLVMG